MESAGNVRTATTLLRVTLGIMFLTHSIVLKVLTFGFAGTAQYFVSIGLPSVTAYLVIAAESVGGTLLVFGIGTRYVALGLLPILLGATYVHSGNGWVFSSAGGGWEYPLFLIVVSVVVALLEKGRLPGVRSQAEAVPSA
jgi:putative oxidoreductase